ncbi:alpha/beta hydrolase [Streptomyces purpureus]|uniref:alpha/beta hydrolase n=1 Tax=Streptomyces purpureus TaxID=1951 RepID=UPI00035D8514|nr:alpha/beta hydrolase [Streptomyces purpureus]
MNSSRFRRSFLALLVTAAVAVPLCGATVPRVPAPRPAAIDTAAGPEARYAANRDNAVEAARMADAHGDHRRAAHLRALADTGRRLLTFDARGTGRAVEVHGDLTRATRIAVLVPGSDTTLDTYERFAKGARALHHELGPDAAVVSWLGYDTPATIGTTVLTPGRAADAAPELRSFVGEMSRLNPGARVAALCHSYGSVVCARAAPGLDIDDLVLYGSPGTGVDTATALGTPARVWAGRGSDDWIAEVPYTSVEVFGTTVGHGMDPVSPGYGARTFDAGDAGHSDYLRPGSTALRSIAGIVNGHARKDAKGDGRA